MLPVTHGVNYALHVLLYTVILAGSRMLPFLTGMSGLITCWPRCCSAGVSCACPAAQAHAARGAADAYIPVSIRYLMWLSWPCSSILPAHHAVPGGAPDE